MMPISPMFRLTLIACALSVGLLINSLTGCGDDFGRTTTTTSVTIGGTGSADKIQPIVSRDGVAKDVERACVESRPISVTQMARDTNDPYDLLIICLDGSTARIEYDYNDPASGYPIDPTKDQG